jgi:hypothetical protein
MARLPPARGSASARPFPHGDPGIAAPRQFARPPRTTWLRTTVAISVLSSVPDMLADAVATRVLLMLTHLLAAAIVISTVTRRLS